MTDPRSFYTEQIPNQFNAAFEAQHGSVAVEDLVGAVPVFLGARAEDVDVVEVDRTRHRAELVIDVFRIRHAVFPLEVPGPELPDVEGGVQWHAVEGATSIDGFWSKKPYGSNVNPAYSTGMIGQSSGRGTWVTPKVCQTTIGWSSTGRSAFT